MSLKVGHVSNPSNRPRPGPSSAGFPASADDELCNLAEKRV